MDHIKPLIEANGDINYWKMGNLQTLCKACHHKKTGEEATHRAEERKQARLLKEKSVGSKDVSNIRKRGSSIHKK